MPNTDKNQDGGHSHPQKSGQNENDQGTSRKSATRNDQDSAEAKADPKESFGSSGPKDSH